MSSLTKAMLWMSLSLSLSLLASGEALAARGPDPGLYRDDDPAASYLRIPPGSRQAFRKGINAAIQKNPRNSVALSHRAHLFLEGGDVERAKRDFDAALANAEPGSEYARNTRWSRGWANYDMGDVDAALADWEQAVEWHGGHPHWATYTLALAYWTLGDADTALAWYDAAVAAMPVMRTEAGLEGRIKHWRAPQQLQMRTLYTAWKARQPVSAG